MMFLSDHTTTPNHTQTTQPNPHFRYNNSLPLLLQAKGDLDNGIMIFFSDYTTPNPDHTTPTPHGHTPG